VCAYLYLQLQLSSFTWLLMPFNVLDMHWALLAAHVPTHTVSVVDSLSLHASNNIVARWRYITPRDNVY